MLGKHGFDLNNHIYREKQIDTNAVENKNDFYYLIYCLIMNTTIIITIHVYT